VAAQLRERQGVDVESRVGRLGEIRVTVDGQDAFVGGLWYPRPSDVVAAIDRTLRTRRHGRS
jgi:hypothetical protein